MVVALTLLRWIGVPMTPAAAGPPYWILMRAFGTWWIPLLIILGLWRYIRRHWPVTYEPALWSVVFRSACTAWPR